MAEPFLGEIKIWAPNFAPRGWAFCDGQLLPIAQNSALFSLLGTIYGGDGRTTFALPDLRGRVPLGVGNGPGLSSHRIGERGGAETTQLTVNDLPAHTHTLNLATAAEGDSNDPAGRLLAQTDARSYSDQGPAVASGGTTAGTGGNRAVNNMQPHLSLHFIIALQGIFPSRS